MTVAGGTDRLRTMPTTYVLPAGFGAGSAGDDEVERRVHVLPGRVDDDDPDLRLAGEVHAGAGRLDSAACHRGGDRHAPVYRLREPHLVAAGGIGEFAGARRRTVYVRRRGIDRAVCVETGE